MPEQASIFEVIDEEADAQALAKARAEIAAGKGVPHERARDWLLRLAKGERLPPPGK